MSSYPWIHGLFFSILFFFTFFFPRAKVVPLICLHSTMQNTITCHSFLLPLLTSLLLVHKDASPSPQKLILGIWKKRFISDKRAFSDMINMSIFSKHPFKICTGKEILFTFWKVWKNKMSILFIFIHCWTFWRQSNTRHDQKIQRYM